LIKGLNQGLKTQIPGCINYLTQKVLTSLLILTEQWSDIIFLKLADIQRKLEDMKDNINVNKFMAYPDMAEMPEKKYRLEKLELQNVCFFNKNI
jgi:hypothetical protein